MNLPQLGGLTLRTPRQVHYVEALRDENIDLIFGVGPAGTGKTFLAVAAAVEGAEARARTTRSSSRARLSKRGRSLAICRAISPRKSILICMPIWDAFRSQMSENDLKARRERRQIEVAPLAFHARSHACRTPSSLSTKRKTPLCCR